ncbi:oxidoreductase [Paenibacillus swuensis]|uniref:Oxidoreductase n=1 Tax=Paenibacillus swuensis TaxID=1178515 RepID=A0A172TLY9_9BACL|nr:molybdopterin-dependent oxidoreductase [Paenibacillus swuensis]ANE47924.1 oxidoreductase [Paenibacillus swuensis]
MNLKNQWKPAMGRLLVKLHRWNAWSVLLLALTGVVLSIGAIRGDLGMIRVWLKNIHTWVGLASVILILFYLPYIRKHVKQIRKKPAQKWNLGLVLGLTVGWILSGIVLWLFRHFPPAWSNTALWIHDLLTWVGIPYILYHSITRMRWMKEPAKRTIVSETSQQVINDEEYKVKPLPPITGKPRVSRRVFLRWGIGAGIAAVFGPSFIRWLGDSLGNGGGGSGKPAAMPGTDANRMLPAPTPLPDSTAVIGGGAKGDFRVYTVTPIPSFTSDDWKFTVGGLVDKPMELDWNAFLALKREVQVSDFHCVTGWSVYSNTWEGIPLHQLLKAAGVKSEARFVKFYSGDGVYTDALSLEQARMEDVIVAVLHDGKPIGADYGGPVRLVVPQMYAYKSVKWLQSIELIAEPHIGYWEERGYDNDAWVNA